VCVERRGEGGGGRKGVYRQKYLNTKHLNLTYLFVSASSSMSISIVFSLKRDSYYFLIS